MTTSRIVRGTKGRILLFVCGLLVITGIIACYNNTRLQLEDVQKSNELCHQQQENLSTQLQVIFDYKQRLEKSLKSEKADRLQARSDFEAKLNQQRLEHEKAASDSKLQYTSLQQHYNLLQTEYSDFKEECSKIQRDHLDHINSLNSKVKEIQGTLTKTQNEYQNTVVHLKSQISQLQNDKVNLEQRLQNTQQENNKELQEENNKLRAQVSKLEEEVMKAASLPSMKSTARARKLENSTQKFGKQIVINKNEYQIKSAQNVPGFVNNEAGQGAMDGPPQFPPQSLADPSQSKDGQPLMDGQRGFNGQQGMNGHQGMDGQGLDGQQGIDDAQGLDGPQIMNNHQVPLDDPFQLGDSQNGAIDDPNAISDDLPGEEGAPNFNQVAAPKIEKPENNSMNVLLPPNMGDSFNRNGMNDKFPDRFSKSKSSTTSRSKLSKPSMDGALPLKEPSMTPETKGKSSSRRVPMEIMNQNVLPIPHNPNQHNANQHSPGKNNPSQNNPSQNNLIKKIPEGVVPVPDAIFEESKQDPQKTVEDDKNDIPDDVNAALPGRYRNNIIANEIDQINREQRVVNEEKENGAHEVFDMPERENEDTLNKLNGEDKANGKQQSVNKGDKRHIDTLGLAGEKENAAHGAKIYGDNADVYKDLANDLIEEDDEDDYPNNIHKEPAVRN